MKMATPVYTEDFFQCSICIEDYTRPRKLPKCGHTFCEECILAYVNKLKEADSLSQGYPCPLCRGINATAADLKDPRQWVNKLEIDVDAVAKLTTSMKTDAEFCGSCLVLRQFSKIQFYCLQCREMMCKSCSSIHQVSKMSRHHIIVNMDEITRNKTGRNLLVKLSEDTVCSGHTDRPIEYFCQDDDALICAACSTDHHRNCKQLVKLCHIVSKTSNKSKSQLLRKKIVNLRTDVQRSIWDRNIAEIERKNQFERVCVELQKVQIKLVKTIDDLQEKSNKTQSVAEDLKEKHRDLDILLTLMDLAVKFGCENQTYISLHKIRKEFVILEEKIKELDNALVEKKSEPDSARILKYLLGIKNANASVQTDTHKTADTAIQTDSYEHVHEQIPVRNVMTENRRTRLQLVRRTSRNDTAISRQTQEQLLFDLLKNVEHIQQRHTDREMQMRRIKQLTPSYNNKDFKRHGNISTAPETTGCCSCLVFLIVVVFIEAVLLLIS